MTHPPKPYSSVLLAVLCLAAAAAQADAPYPRLSVELSADHPVFIFYAPAWEGIPPEAYAPQLLGAWRNLPDTLRPYALLGIDPGPQPEAYARCQDLLTTLQEAEIPSVLRVAGGGLAAPFSPEQTEKLLADFTRIRGIEATGLRFNEYPPPGPFPPGELPAAAWLGDVIEAAARYGRFTHIPLEGLAWPRIMANTNCDRLWDRILACQGYAIPACLYRGPQTVTAMSATLGTWLEGTVENWGIAADSRWYTDARFIAPGHFGKAPEGTPIPAPLYRAMMLNGAMTGATLYAFPNPADLWFGENRAHWNEAIRPTLEQLLDLSIIPRRDSVEKKVKAAYLMAPATNPQEFHLNLRDIDPVYDAGHLLHGAYGIERPGQIPELILNRGDRYWIPLLSARAQEETFARFSHVVRAGSLDSAAAWNEFLGAADAPPAGPFIAEVGRRIFVMNTRENIRERQAFELPAVPAPVRGLRARRDGDHVILDWPFREGDMAYSVYRRILPETGYTELVRGKDARQYIDQAVGTNETLAYAVTALTIETEPYAGTVGYGDYQVFSVVESRIAQEALLSPLLYAAESEPIAQAAEQTVQTPDTPPEWWVTYEGIGESRLPMAHAIAQRVDQWDAALETGDLQALLDLYSTQYKDPQGWGFEYVRRAYQWFLERYRAHHMHRQVRLWDFAGYEATGRVNLLLYCRLTAIAISDPTGRFADQPVALPGTQAAEVWVTWSDVDGPWRIIQTNPALPNFKDLLSYSAGPHNALTPGPDTPPTALSASAP